MQGQILYDITAAYASATSTWLDTLQPLAQRLFVALATIEIAWSGIWWAIERQREGVEGVVAPMLRKLFTLMFFYTALLLAPTWIPTVIAGFVRAGQVASGFDSLNPSTVMEQGIDVAVGMLASISGIWSVITTPPWLYFGAIVVVIAFALIAANLLVTLVESYLVIGGGILMLGFSGSRWTVSFATGYFLYAMKVGVKLFTLYLLVGIGMSLPATWMLGLNTPDAWSPRYFFEVVGGSLVLLMLTWRIPQLASRMLDSRSAFPLERAYGG